MSHKIMLQRTFVDREQVRFDVSIANVQTSVAAKLQKYEDIFKKYIEDETRKIRELGTDLISNKKMDTDSMKSKKSFYPAHDHPSAKYYFKGAGNNSETASKGKAISNT
jgi:hypothetical protein